MRVSVKKAAEIAKTYGYKTEVVSCYGGRAFLSVFDNFLKSPYPRHFTSVVRSHKYVDKVFTEL